MADEVDVLEERPVPSASASRLGRTGKWLLGLAAALVFLVASALVVLNTPLGERFLANRIAERTFPNGLNIRIGRIEGNLYGAAILHDVQLSDPQGVFLTIPRAEIDWNPGAWLSNRLEIDSFAARRAQLARIPEFLPSEEEGPILPGFDISVEEFMIENLTLARGIAGDRAQRVDLAGSAQVADRRLMVDLGGRLGQRDRLALLLDAEPDGDDFDMSLDVAAEADGPLAQLAGLDTAHTARIRGDGTWSQWTGGLLVQSEEGRVAALRLTNRAGIFGLLGKIDPSDYLSGIPARALGEDVALQAELAIDNRVFDGRVRVIGRGLGLVADGLLDLAENRVDALELDAFVRDPGLLGDGLELRNTRLTATLDGPLRDLAIAHDLRVGELDLDGTLLAGLRQQGTAQYDGTRWSLPLDVAVASVTSGNALVDPRLVNGIGRGTLVLTGSRLLADDLRIAFPGTSANLALRGDVASGRYRIRGPVRAQQLVLDDVGRAGGTAMIDLALAPGAPWRLTAQLDARISPVTNATLANLAGAPIRVRGGVAMGGAASLEFDRLRVDASKVQLALDGSVREGTTRVAGAGTHVDFGDFTVEANVSDAGPSAALVFARPATGLENVRLAIAPSDEGFAIDAAGDSLLGPFAGTLDLTAPEGGPTRIAIDRMRVSETGVTGSVAFVEGGAEGMLAFAGGGLDGTVALAPRGGGQGLDIALQARNARFGGETPLRIARADVEASGLIRQGTTTFVGSGTAAGLSYGTLFIARLAAQGEVENGIGQIDASLAGRRSGRFVLDVNAGISSDRIALAAQGEFAGRRISMPRRAVLTNQADGGWRLAPTQLSYGDGGLIASGSFGGGDLDFDFKLARMPLSLIDIVRPDTGLGGTISGVVTYRTGADRLPVSDAKVRIDGLTRSGLVLTSRPVDVALVARLSETELEARALLRNNDIRRGRVQARITDLPGSGILIDRLRAGGLFAQLRYHGAAESLWRFAALDTFDITGPIAIAADATGTLEDPTVRGSISGETLQLRSSLSGTDIRDISVRGRFRGSRLQLARFAGTPADGGSVSGSGIVDLRTLGEAVEGRVLEIRGPIIDLRIAARNAQLIETGGLSATITGPLRIVSNGLGGTIAGRVRVDRASWRLGTAADDLRLPQIATREINAPANRAPQVAPGRPWRYLVDARAASRIDVDGMGLDSEWSADIILRGTTDDPRIGGSAEVVRGDYTFAGTRFELTRGEIEFDANVPIDPRLDIRAETERDGLTVEATVRGSATQPEIAFSSNPSLPEEELLARLLFGGSVTSLSATDALQLGAAVASLRGGGGMDPINQLRSAIGLDRLRIVSADPALGRGTGVALGKNFGRRFYAEIITDGRGYSATEVEFRVTSWLSLLAAVSTVGRESVVAEISRDY
ncbi:translocation/assembly module TamB domain-containing protein [Erythrobacter sp.]|uniref:translocation/assembly module TamB domain-containing protein n=1 Tax=Erythrobacter sp. TaxID=1042 RepID=UPI001B146EFE|nr:translocation/assembly module TamB domain-containing protein [Erythrobacter sp.]MBO6525756.1 translocation/assembly module TamB domain-containing protein [Erythrobacter sp.]MBO6529569.1 translocation/assembly module TamB domain-containing protein [Erythrobacter sp.]